MRVPVTAFRGLGIAAALVLAGCQGFPEPYLQSFPEPLPQPRDTSKLRSEPNQKICKLAFTRDIGMLNP
jgi:hypothetical protein